MMSSLSWNQLNERCNFQLLMIVFKCLQNVAPSYISSQFIFTSAIHSKGTRSQSCNTLVLPSWNDNSGKRTFHYRGAYIWNTVSPQIRCNYASMKLNTFLNLKIKCKYVIIEHCILCKILVLYLCSVNTFVIYICKYCIRVSRETSFVTDLS